jgi:hypothetical protein
MSCKFTSPKSNGCHRGEEEGGGSLSSSSSSAINNNNNNNNHDDDGSGLRGMPLTTDDESTNNDPKNNVVCRVELEYAPTVVSSLIVPNFQVVWLLGKQPAAGSSKNQSPNLQLPPPHVCGYSVDFCLTEKKIESYHLLGPQGQREEHRKWNSFSKLDREMYLRNIELLIQQQQSYLLGGSDGAGSSPYLPVMTPTTTRTRTGVIQDTPSMQEEEEEEERAASPRNQNTPTTITAIAFPSNSTAKSNGHIASTSSSPSSDEKEQINQKKIAASSYEPRISSDATIPKETKKKWLTVCVQVYGELVLRRRRAMVRHVDDDETANMVFFAAAKRLEISQTLLQRTIRIETVLSAYKNKKSGTADMKRPGERVVPPPIKRPNKTRAPSPTEPSGGSRSKGATDTQAKWNAVGSSEREKYIKKVPTPTSDGQSRVTTNTSGEGSDDGVARKTSIRITSTASSIKTETVSTTAAPSAKGSSSTAGRDICATNKESQSGETSTAAIDAAASLNGMISGSLQNFANLPAPNDSAAKESTTQTSGGKGGALTSLGKRAAAENNDDLYSRVKRTRAARVDYLHLLDPSRPHSMQIQLSRKRSRRPWTKEEDDILRKAFKEYLGEWETTRWTDIAEKYFPGTRNGIQVRARWFSKSFDPEIGADGEEE